MTAAVSTVKAEAESERARVNRAEQACMVAQRAAAAAQAAAATAEATAAASAAEVQRLRDKVAQLASVFDTVRDIAAPAEKGGTHATSAAGAGRKAAEVAGHVAFRAGSVSSPRKSDTAGLHLLLAANRPERSTQGDGITYVD